MKELILRLKRENPAWGYDRIAQAAGCSKSAARFHLNSDYQTSRKVLAVKRYNKKKLDLVASCGGKCQKCGYDKCVDALEFHHLDSDVKEFTIAYKTTQSYDKLLKEVEKCMLLCSNCHREIHWAKRNQ